MGPSQYGQGGHGEEHDHEAPVVDRAGSWMAACALGAEHGDDPRDGTDESRSHMHGHDAEKHRRGGRDRNPEDDDALIGQERPAPSVNRSGAIAVIHTSLHR